MSALTALWILDHERPAIKLFYLTLLETFAGDWIKKIVMMNFKLTTSYSVWSHHACPIIFFNSSHPLLSSTTRRRRNAKEEEEEGTQKKKMSDLVRPPTD